MPAYSQKYASAALNPRLTSSIHMPRNGNSLREARHGQAVLCAIEEPPAFSAELSPSLRNNKGSLNVPQTECVVLPQTPEFQVRCRHFSLTQATPLSSSLHAPSHLAPTEYSGPRGVSVHSLTRSARIPYSVYVGSRRPSPFMCSHVLRSPPPKTTTLPPPRAALVHAPVSPPRPCYLPVLGASQLLGPAFPDAPAALGITPRGWSATMRRHVETCMSRRRVGKGRRRPG